MKILVQTNENDIVISYAVCLHEEHKPIQGKVINTNINLDEIEILHNYKLVNNELIELTASEKSKIPSIPTQEDFLLDLELRMTLLELGLAV